MKKTLFYVLLIAALGIGVWAILFRGGDTAFKGAESAFSVKDTASIGKIFLAVKNGNTVTLQRTHTGWRLNNKYDVASVPMQLLLVTLEEQEARAPVPHVAHDNAIKNLAGDGVKTEIYDTLGRKLKTFYVGGKYQNGTLMLMEGSETPYVVEQTGFTGELRPRYGINEEDWRSKLIFALQPKDIRSIAVEYPRNPVNSFTIAQQDGKISVTTAPELQSNPAQLNQKRATDYLNFYSKIYLEAFDNGLSGVDSDIAHTLVKGIITVTPVKGTPQKLFVYYKLLNRRSKNLANASTSEENMFDADYLYGVLNNGVDTVDLSVQSFNRLLVRGYQFYQQ